MHELPVTKSILRIVLEHARKHRVTGVLTIRLKIGEMSDLEDGWIQRYFDYVSKGTVAEGARIMIERSPVRMKCGECGELFTVELRKIRAIRCPECCGTELTLVSGDEYYIQSIEVR